MAVFDFARAGSGSPIIYGLATVCTDDKMSGVRTLNVTAGNTIIPASGATPQFFRNLEPKYLSIPASGWGQ